MTIAAPSLVIAASLASGAVSGTMTPHSMPRARAHHATPWAMFPALAVKTPRASCSLVACAMALVAPRSLNEPIGCRFSSFK